MKRAGKMVYEGRVIETPEGVSTDTFFNHGGTDPTGYVVCTSFAVGDKVYQSAYEQTMLEVTVEKVYGTLNEGKGTVNFKGISAVSVKGVLQDAVEGTFVWETEEEGCKSTASQVYLGPGQVHKDRDCLLYTSPSPRDKRQSRMPSSA